MTTNHLIQTTSLLTKASSILSSLCVYERVHNHDNDVAESLKLSIIDYLSSALTALESHPSKELPESTALKDNHLYVCTNKQTTYTQNSFSARLRLAITYSGMTQAALAWGIGVSQSTISALVTGKSKEAGVVRARAIAEVLEVNAQWLLYGEGDMCSKQSESFESQAARIKFSGSNI